MTQPGLFDRPDGPDGTGGPRRGRWAAVKAPSEAWTTQIAAYAVHLGRDQRAAVDTVRLRRSLLRRLASWCTHTGPAPVEPWQVTRQDLLDWMGEHPHWLPETRKAAQGAVRSFYAWAQETERTHVDPARRLPAVPIPRAMPRPIPDEQTRAALTRATARERDMVLLGALLGLRCMEIATVHSDNLAGDLLTVTGKGGHQRTIPLLDEGLRARIRAADGYLFPGRVQGHLSARYISRLLGQLLPGRYTAHTLRHRAATVALEHTENARAVQELLGHASIRTIERYTLVSPASLRRVAAATHQLF